jgi:hypothetical protein
MAAGMFAAAAGGIGIGMFLPTDWLAGGKRDGHDGSVQQPPAPVSDASTRQDSAVVHETVRDIAEDIPRPAIIQDATRAEVEALYEFHSCLASGGSATVWRATEIKTGRTVAIKVVDKRLLLTPCACRRAALRSASAAVHAPSSPHARPRRRTRALVTAHAMAQSGSRVVRRRSWRSLEHGGGLSGSMRGPSAHCAALRSV